MAGSQRSRGATPSGGKGARRPSVRTGAARPAAGARATRLTVSLGTRRAAVLAVGVCALALALAVPLRTYVSQRQQLEETARTQGELTSEVAELQSRVDQLDDPAYVRAQARERLQYVLPGQTPYEEIGRAHV